MTELGVFDKKKLIEKIESFIQKSVSEYEKEGVVIGISGGIDAALVAFLAREAVGKEKLTLFRVVERDTPSSSEKYSQLVSDFLEVPLKKVNLTLPLLFLGIYKLENPLGFLVPEKAKKEYTLNIFNSKYKDYDTLFKHILGKGDEEFRKHLAYYSAKARIITLIAYKFADLENKLVIDTANKTELSTGFIVRCGEAGDIMPLASLYKTQVRELAEYVGIPEEIIRKPPSPDIVPFITDEQVLGVSYELLDKILIRIEKGLDDVKISKELSVQPEVIYKYRKLREIALKIGKIPIRLEI